MRESFPMRLGMFTSNIVEKIKYWIILFLISFSPSCSQSSRKLVSSTSSSTVSMDRCRSRSIPKLPSTSSTQTVMIFSWPFSFWSSKCLSLNSLPFALTPLSYQLTPFVFDFPSLFLFSSFLIIFAFTPAHFPTFDSPPLSSQLLNALNLSFLIFSLTS